jgi:hypothetical protein
MDKEANIVEIIDEAKDSINTIKDDVSKKL